MCVCVYVRACANVYMCVYVYMRNMYINFNVSNILAPCYITGKKLIL